jgi:uncharacterized protein (DUF1684 family)
VSLEGAGDYLALADWRRRVAVIWQEWREAAAGNAEPATTAFRVAKDELFRDHPQSPLRPEDRAGFLGLDYWPYDAAWRMEVRLTDAPAASTLDAPAMPGPLDLGSMSLPNSGQEAIAFSRIGSVELVGPLRGQRLSLYWIQGYGGGLFLPFRDATSGGATYGAGRYLLDSIKSADHGGDWRTGTLLLDFNMAYHPSCAYDPLWACPLAPPENRLAVPVEVGERLPWRSA